MIFQKCISCDQEYELDSIGFEQRLINDTDFCPKCWKEIMTEEEAEFQYLKTL